MVKRPVGFNPFEFAVLGALRAAQLTRGCTPRVKVESKVYLTALTEVAEGKVERAVAAVPEPVPV
jgi:DNA-directed RNA polymerase subunit K/omega